MAREVVFFFFYKCTMKNMKNGLIKGYMLAWIRHPKQ